MSTGEVLYSAAGGVATITLHRPDKLNAWTADMDTQFHHAMRRAAADDTVRVIVVTGAGKGFCAGADMNLLKSISSDGSPAPGLLATSMEPAAPSPAEFARKHAWLLTIPKPIIAAINGVAAGLGLIIPLYCDFRIAASSARFSTVFSKRGLVAEYGLAWILPRIVGYPQAIELLYTSKMIDSEEALRIGLASRVFPDDVFGAEADAFARDLATNVSPRSLRVMKLQMVAALTQNFGDAYDAAIAEMKESLVCEDFREGVAHFLEKRAPQFTGR